MTIAVKQQNLEEMERIIYAVSDPTSPTYGEHLTYEAVHELTANPRGTAATLAWLKSHGITVVESTDFGEYIEATASVAQWNALLAADLQAMRHIHSDGTVIRSKEFTMPVDLESHVSHIFSVVELPLRQAPVAQAQRADEPAIAAYLEKSEARAARVEGGAAYPCHSVMTPQCWVRCSLSPRFVRLTARPPPALCAATWRSPLLFSPSSLLHSVLSLTELPLQPDVE